LEWLYKREWTLYFDGSVYWMDCERGNFTDGFSDVVETIMQAAERQVNQ
jgi:hypothetical protein